MREVMESEREFRKGKGRRLRSLRNLRYEVQIKTNTLTGLTKHTKSTIAFEHDNARNKNQS